MKKGIVFTLVVAAILATVLFIRGKDFVFRLSESQLEAAMEKSLPLTETYFFVVDVTLSNPSVDLKSGASRIGGGLDVLLELSFLGLKEKAKGHIVFSGEVSYKRETKQFFLVRPVVENIAIEGISEAKSNQANQAISAALAAYYEETPVYTLKRSDVKTFTTSLFLKSVVVEREKLVITMGI